MNLQTKHDIAIIGLSGRFPGAQNIGQFWENLINSKESISIFSEKELQLAHISDELISNFNYIKSRGILNNIELFDAQFFGFTPTEAELTDPQHRIFLECAWEALENSGYASDDYSGSIGVYAGTGNSSYFLNNIYPNQISNNVLQDYLQHVGNDKDFLTTKVSYKLNLKGPSIVIQTACSTSLVAICVACKELLTYQCDIALAGGSSVSIPQISGYMYEQGMIFSPDGHCRPLDAEAQGTVPGNGAGIVVLKRLEEALNDNDHIYAVIKGCGVNNDGMRKIGYSAPSVQGQTEAIIAAISMANIDPETITYVEAHGTATLLGDPIEIKALTEAFQAYTLKKQYAAIGSVKSNLGHLIEASGVAGLIKTCLSLYYRKLLPTLNFQTPNPNISFEKTPFYVNTELKEWDTDQLPRRACVSSFGIGGTNAHIILEEITKNSSSSSNRPFHIITLSAKTKTALNILSQNLAKYINEQPEINLSDIAYTLQIGRKSFLHRQAFICSSLQEACFLLQKTSNLSEDRLYIHTVNPEKNLSITFMIPNEVNICVNTGLIFYKQEPIYRHWIDKCSELFFQYLHKDIRKILFPSNEDINHEHVTLKSSCFAQVSSFITSYALAQLWMEWGVYPENVFGFGVGEIVADVLLNKCSLEHGIKQVATATNFSNSDVSITFQELLENPSQILIEVGAGNNICSSLRNISITNKLIIASLPNTQIPEKDYESLFSLLAKLWTMGVSINWKNFSAYEIHHRIPLPTYPFEKKRFWIDPPTIIKNAYINDKKFTSSKKTNCAEINSIDIMQTTLLTIWKQYLKLENINIKSDFFKIGGDSIIALQIISDISNALSIELTLQTFLTYNTVEKLAFRLVNENLNPINCPSISSPISPLLIKLKEGSSIQSPIFCIHPITGHALCYKTFADTLKYDGNVYGIQAPSLVLNSPPNLSNIETIAFYYIEVIRSIQPSGPYFLLGASFGALIAYEMAQQLLDSNQSIPLLIMLDIIKTEILLENIDLNSNIFELLFDLFNGPSFNRENTQNLTLEQLSIQLIHSMGLGMLSSQEQEKVIQQIQLSWKALQRYKTRFYSGNILFFEAEDRFIHTKHLSCGTSWGTDLIPNLDIHILPGRHLEMLNLPIVSSLANIVDTYLIKSLQVRNE